VLQLPHLGVIEGAQPQITSDGLLMLGDRRLIIEARLDEYDRNPEVGSSWEEAKANILTGPNAG